MSIEKCVTNVESVDTSVECDFFFEQNTTYAINPGRYLFPFKANDVFMAFRAVIFTLIFMEP